MAKFMEARSRDKNYSPAIRAYSALKETKVELPYSHYMNHTREKIERKKAKEKKGWITLKLFPYQLSYLIRYGLRKLYLFYAADLLFCLGIFYVLLNVNHLTSINISLLIALLGHAFSLPVAIKLTSFFSDKKYKKLKIIEFERFMQTETGHSASQLHTDVDARIYNIADALRTSVPFNVPLEFYKTPIHRVAYQ